MRAAPIASAVLAVQAALAAVGGLGKGEERPSLYELTARSNLVVSARVLSGSLKRAEVEIREVYRGTARPGQHLEIAFRDFNTSLSKADRIVFSDGESEVLFLVPEVTEDGRQKGGNRYTLTRGRFGRFTLPREGEEIYLEAIREFAGLVALKDHRELFRRLKGLLRSSNPVLVDVGLNEVLKLDLMEASLATVVMNYYRDPAPKRRISATKLMGRLFEKTRDRERSADLQESTLPPLAVLARNDPDEQVRVAAVNALGAWGGAAVTGTLREIAQQDTAQAVRYQAQVILLREAEAKKAPREGGRKSP